MLQSTNFWVETKLCHNSGSQEELAFCGVANFCSAACVCQLGSYLLKLQPFSTLGCRMGESHIQGLQCCCGNISMRPQDKQKWPPWFNTSVEDGCNKVDLSHAWGSWKKWCVQAEGTWLLGGGGFSDFEKVLHNCSVVQVQPSISQFTWI